MIIKGLFQIAIGLTQFFFNMGRLPTNEQLEAWGHKPVLYQQPGPWVFNQRAHRHEH
jgi:hypothetical protein